MMKLFIFIAASFFFLAYSYEEPTCAVTAPSDKWRYYCNWCHCENQTTVCTRKLCTGDLMAIMKKEPECVGTAQWKKMCSWCHCKEGMAICTKMGGSEDCPSTHRQDDCDATKCPEYRMVEYMAVKGCTPVYVDDHCCASRFECTGNAPKKTSCTYHEKSYSDGAKIPVENDCYYDCVCRGSEIKCEERKCSLEKLKPHCYPKYSLKHCCMVAQTCETIKGPLCVWDDKEYIDGQKMDFSDAPCRRCVCNPLFAGPYGPKCEKRSCDYDIKFGSEIQKGCVPKFFREKCCPDSFICPGDGVISKREQNGANEGAEARSHCLFGNLTVAVGDPLATSDLKVDCACLVPPEITCVQTSY